MHMTESHGGTGSASVRAIAFDVFGTLLLSPSPIPYRHLLQTNEPAERRRLMTSGDSLVAHAQRLGSKVTTVELLCDLQTELDQISLFPDVTEAIDTLRRWGYRLAACSNLASDYVPIVRKSLPSLDAYVMSCEVGAVKPEPAIYRRLCEMLQLAPEQIMFVGDSLRCDVDDPKNFGMSSVHLDRRRSSTLLQVISDGLAQRP
jgi:HAD superfamily hydrolase (TIGR01549 family)